MRLKKALVVSETSTYSEIDNFIQSCFFLSDSLAGREGPSRILNEFSKTIS